MGIPNERIGSSAELKMLHQISQQLDRLIKLTSKLIPVTTTTSTTAP